MFSCAGLSTPLPVEGGPVTRIAGARRAGLRQGLLAWAVAGRSIAVRGGEGTGVRG